MEATMRAVSLLTVAALLAAPLSAQSSCKLEGVWQFVSGTADGNPYTPGIRGIKIITKGHFAVLEREPGVPQEMKSQADSLAAFVKTISGGGTYTVQGTTYTEKLDYFSDPTYVGRAVPFTCRTEGDRFYQSGPFPIFEGGKKVRDIKLAEVWKRVE
jgi:hypothetical protein